MNLDNYLTALITLWLSHCIRATHQNRGTSSAHAKPKSSGASILEIMNHDHINKVLAERQEATRLQKEDESNETESPEIYPLVGFEYNKNSPHDQQAKGSIQYNDTIVPIAINGKPPRHHQLLSADSSPESPFHRSAPDKVLKTSKNALYVTRKEYLKKDWCKTEPLLQKIREDGCISRNIVNRFCYGQCNSFFIPKSPKGSNAGRAHRPSSAAKHSAATASLGTDVDEPDDLTEAVFRSCAFCTPSKFAWITVTLRCPSLVPPIRYKKIQRIRQCRCMTELQV